VSKRHMTLTKETYYSVKENYYCCDQFASRHAVPGKVWHESCAMAQCQKRPITVSKETNYAYELLCAEFVSKHALLYVHYTRKQPDRQTHTCNFTFSGGGLPIGSNSSRNFSSTFSTSSFSF
jgi:hypothetical protein